LFKRYQPEKGTVSVSRILEESDELIFISSITIIEIISNLKRLCEVDKITTEEQFTEQRAFFYQDIGLLILLFSIYLLKTLSRLKILL